jgi:hypothetical protein
MYSRVCVPAAVLLAAVCGRGQCGLAEARRLGAVVAGRRIRHGADLGRVTVAGDRRGYRPAERARGYRPPEGARREAVLGAVVRGSGAGVGVGVGREGGGGDGAVLGAVVRSGEVRARGGDGAVLGAVMVLLGVLLLRLRVLLILLLLG